MKKLLKTVLGACLDGQCGFVEISNTQGDYETKVLWCRYCGKIEVYETLIENGVEMSSRQSVSLNPQILQIVKEYLSGRS